jgi:isopentenyldiphosphate isomerase
MSEPAFELTVEDRLGDYMEALRSQLERSLGVKFVHGYLVGPNRTTADQGSVNVRSENEMAGRVIEWEIKAVIRMLKQFDDAVLQDPDSPYDPRPLYVWAAALQQVMKAHQTDMGPWSQRIVQIDIDTTVQGLTAQLLAQWDNPGLSGA